MKGERVALFAVVGMVLAAGCMDVTVTTEVGADGDIESMSVEMEVDAMVYFMLEDTAQQEGYDSVEEYFQADVNEDADEDVEFDDVSVSQTDDGTYVVSMVATDVDPDTLEDIDVTVAGDTVRYEATESPEDSFEDGLDGANVDDGGNADGDGGDDYDDAENDYDDDADDLFGEDSVTFEYTVVMPGEIGDTNADEVSDDGTTATWHLEDEEAPTYYAESDIGDASPASGTGDSTAEGESLADDEESVGSEADPEQNESGNGEDGHSGDGDGGDGVPGFGPGVAVIALLLSAAGLGLRNR